MKTLDIVHIVWRDALSNSVFWEDLDDVVDSLETERDLMETVGQIVEVDKRYVTIAHSMHYDSSGAIAKAGGVLSIPVGCVIKMRKISGPIKRKL
ncbi:MAG: hypothetical protein QMD92_00235 [bacterium]|nr:hypothetical protein [bacterium]